jgi:hypothetical protein
VTIYNSTNTTKSLVSGTSLTLYWAGLGSTGNRSLALNGLATVVYINATTAVISGAGVF